MGYTFQAVVPAYDGRSDVLPARFRNPALKNVPAQVGTPERINIFNYSIYNPNAVDCFLKMYDSVAAPTVGVTTPICGTPIWIAANSQAVLYGTDVYAYCILGLWVAVTTSYLDTDNTAPATGLMVSINYIGYTF